MLAVDQQAGIICFLPFLPMMVLHGAQAALGLAPLFRSHYTARHRVVALSSPAHSYYLQRVCVCVPGFPWDRKQTKPPMPFAAGNPHFSICVLRGNTAALSPGWCMLHALGSWQRCL